MVNTFMKTQHQHVMPQRKERKTLKANTWADPGRRWRARSPPASERGDRARAASVPHSTAHPSPSVFLLVQPPRQPPSPGGKRPNTTGETMECVKTLTGGSLSLKEPTPTPQKKYHASFIPIAYLHLGQQTCSQKVENRYDKTWLENDRRARPRDAHELKCARSNARGRNTAHQGQYGIIIYSKNGHVPRLNLYFFLLSFTVE